LIVGPSYGAESSFAYDREFCDGSRRLVAVQQKDLLKYM
jgi:hypothetical protein